MPLALFIYASAALAASYALGRYVTKREFEERMRTRWFIF